MAAAQQQHPLLCYDNNAPAAKGAGAGAAKAGATRAGARRRCVRACPHACVFVYGCVRVAVDVRGCCLPARTCTRVCGIDGAETGMNTTRRRPQGAGRRQQLAAEHGQAAAAAAAAEGAGQAGASWIGSGLRKQWPGPLRATPGGPACVLGAALLIHPITWGVGGGREPAVQAVHPQHADGILASTHLVVR